MGKGAGQIVGTLFQVVGTVLMFVPGFQVVGMALMVAGGLIGAATAKKPKLETSAFDLNFEQGGHKTNARSTSEPIPVLYGEVRVGGNQVFMTATGSSNEYLHIVQTISEGEIDSVSEVWLDDKLSTDPFFDGHVNTEIFTGSQTQGICQALASAYPDWNDAMRGTAYLYIRLKFNREKFQQVPLITVKAKGRKLYDPRNSQTAWKNNGALAEYDMQTNKVYGFGLNSSVIDSQSIIDAANKIDTMAYTFNCFVNGREPAQDIIDRMLINFRGFLIYTDGVYKLKIYDYDSPVMTITDDNIIEDSFEIVAPGLPETPNRLKVKFIDPELKYAVNDFIYEDNAAITLDGMERENEVNLIGCTSYDQASEIATFQLERQRLNKTFVCGIGSKGNSLELGDIISITNSFAGWTAQSVRVISINYLPNYDVGLTLVEEAAALYDKKLNVSPHTWFSGSFPEPTEQVPEASGVEFLEELYGTKNNILTKLKVSFLIPSGWVWYDHSEAWISTDAGVTYSRYLANAINSFYIDPVTEGITYYVKILPVSIYGVRRAIADCTAHTKYIFGKTAKPADITEFWGQASIGGLRLDWAAVADVDLDYYKIRYTPDTAGGTWDNAIDVATTYSTSITLPAALSGKYLIKAVDTSGNESENALAYITTIPTVLNWNAQENLIEDPVFPGTKTDMFVENGELILGSGEMFDSDGMFDSDEDFDFGGGVAANGYYETDVVNLGSVQTCRCSSSIQFSGVNTLETFDANDMFDSDEMFDGTPADIGIIPQIALSQDGSTWGAWQNFFAGDYTAKAFKFRVHAYSNQTFQYLKISDLEFNVDMPDREVRSADVVTVPVIGYRITLSIPFIKMQKIGIDIRNAQAGDEAFYSIVNNSTVDIWVDNAGSPVQRQCAYALDGY